MLYSGPCPLHGLLKGKFPVTPDKLTCNFTECPMNISSDGPGFSWQLISGLRNQSQSAFRILVSDNQQDLSSDMGNIWDSGKYQSTQSILVEYAGPELKPAQTYFWKVRVWNQEGAESRLEQGRYLSYFTFFSG